MNLLSSWVHRKLNTSVLISYTLFGAGGNTMVADAAELLDPVTEPLAVICSTMVMGKNRIETYVQHISTAEI